MKHTLLASAIVTALIASPIAFAGPDKSHSYSKHRNHFSDTARVTQVEPIITTVRVTEPSRECWTEEVEYRRGGGDRAAGMIIGGLIGGALGHNLDDHRNAPAVGALIGSAIGHDVAGRHDRGHRHKGYEERCRTVNNTYEDERIDGYRVTYRYQGNSYTTRMAEHPGDRIKVRVSIRPVAGY